MASLILLPSASAEVVNKPVDIEPTVEQVIASYDWDYDIAYAVMIAESHKRESVVNPEWHYDAKGNPICQGSIGLFQIACIHDSPEKLKDPEYNIKRAYDIYSEGGWRPWGVCHNGKVDCNL